MADRISLYDHRRKVGNAGDVWKHLLLLTVVDRLSRESNFLDRPFRYYESHCGRGVYLLPQEGEWRSGVGRTFPPPRPLHLHPYFRLLGSRPTLYFGSWFLIALLLQERGLDFHLWLCDSSWEVARQMDSMGISESRGGRVLFRKTDGFSPPSGPRSWDLALIDPPYTPEPDVDLRRSLALVREMIHRGTPSLLWYPVREGVELDPGPPGGITLELLWPNREDRPAAHMKGCGILATGRVSRFLVEALDSLRTVADRLKAEFRIRNAEEPREELQ